MIPVNEPRLGQRELDNVIACVQSGWISSAGRYIDAFEEQWAAYCGRRFGVSVCNGTAALHAAVASLDLEPGDEVIVPSFTIISCALAILYAGGTPVLVDCDPHTWTMDVEQAAHRITPRTRAIMPVHIYGHPVDLDAVIELADRHGLAVIEDAAEAHGAEYLADLRSGGPEWRRCGSFGDLSCFSFYANKLLTTGEGGMVVTDNPVLVEKLRAFRNLCFNAQRRFYHESLGYNYRMTNLQAALGLAQVERMEEVVARKREIGAAYTRRLQGLSAIQLPIERPWARSVYWMYGLVLTDEAGGDADDLAFELRVRGVDTRPFFLGLHEQPALQHRGLFRGERYPVTERIARQGLYLPSGVALTDAQLTEVCNRLREVLS
jgi:perosamine synthetase